MKGCAPKTSFSTPPAGGGVSLCSFIRKRTSSGEQRTQPGMTRDQRHAFDQTIEAPDMARVMRHQVDDHDRVDEVVVDEETEVILNKWPFHMREVVGHH